MFGILSARVGYDEKGRRYGFIEYGEKDQYLFILLEGEPYYNNFFNVFGDFDVVKMLDKTRLISSYSYTTEEEFLLAIKIARQDWKEYVNPFLKIV